MQNKKKPNPTIKKRKASAENGSLKSIIGFVVMKADDQRIININGNILIIVNYSYNALFS